MGYPFRSRHISQYEHGSLHKLWLLRRGRPTEAILTDEPPDTIKDKCIVCAACIKYCPSKARMFGNSETIKEYASHLVYAVARKEAVIFI